jgi:hypothetical protein
MPSGSRGGLRPGGLPGDLTNRRVTREQADAFAFLDRDQLRGAEAEAAVEPVIDLPSPPFVPIPSRLWPRVGRSGWIGAVARRRLQTAIASAPRTTVAPTMTSSTQWLAVPTTAKAIAAGMASAKPRTRSDAPSETT